MQPVPKTPELAAYIQQMDALDQQEKKVEGDLAALKRTPGPRPGPGRRARRGGASCSGSETETKGRSATWRRAPAAPPRAELLSTSADPQDYPVLIRGEAAEPGAPSPRAASSRSSPGRSARLDPRQRPPRAGGGHRRPQAIRSPPA